MKEMTVKMTEKNNLVNIKNNEMIKLHNDYEKVEKETNVLRQYQQTNEIRIQQLGSTLDQVTSEKEKVENTMKQQKETFEKEMKQVQKECQALTLEILHLKDENTVLLNELTTMNEKNDEYSVQKRSLEETLKKADQYVESIMKQKENANDLLNKSEQQRQNVERKNGVLERNGLVMTRDHLNSVNILYVVLFHLIFYFLNCCCLFFFFDFPFFFCFFFFLFGKKSIYFW